MDVKNNDRVVQNMSLIYFATVSVAVLNEYYWKESALLLFKLAIVPFLLILYCFCSTRRNIVYLLALLFSFLRNIFFMDPKLNLSFQGQISYTIFLILVLVLLFKIIKVTRILSIVIAIIPFISIFSYLLTLIKNSNQVSVNLGILDVILMSLFGAISVSNYVFNDNKKNSFLLLSCLFFTALIFVFVIQKYFSLDGITHPILIILYSISNYFFFRFVIEDEIDEFILEINILE